MENQVYQQEEEEVVEEDILEQPLNEFEEKLEMIHQTFKEQQKKMNKELLQRQQKEINNLKKNFDLSIFQQKSKQREGLYKKEGRQIFDLIQNKNIDLNEQFFKNVLPITKNPDKYCKNATNLLNLFKTDLQQLSQTLSKHSKTVHKQVELQLSDFDKEQETIQKTILEFIDKISVDLKKIEIVKNLIQERLQTIKQSVQNIRSAFYIDMIKFENKGLEEDFEDWFDPEIIQKYQANGRVLFSHKNRTFQTTYNSSPENNNCLLLGKEILTKGRYNWSLKFQKVSDTAWNYYGVMEASNIPFIRKCIDLQDKSSTYTIDHKSLSGLQIDKNNSRVWRKIDSFNELPPGAQRDGSRLDFEVDFTRNEFTISYKGKTYLSKKIEGLQLVPYFHIRSRKGFKATLTIPEQ